MSNVIRAKFSRGEEVKYISHLDLMQVFERAARRAHVPILYSQGFNPHPQMVFGLPLSVGVTSESEYGDFELSEEIKPSDFIEKMNGSLPKGFAILEAKPKQVKGNIMATISTASYEVLVSTGESVEIPAVQEQIEKMMEKPAIIVKKEGKNGVKDVDIKSMIYKLQAKFLKGSELEEPKSLGVAEQDSLYCSNPWLIEYVKDLRESGLKFSYKLENIFCLSMLVSAGSAANLKPDLLVLALNESAEMGLKLVKIHRTGLFTGKEGDLTHPLSDRVLLGV